MQPLDLAVFHPWKDIVKRFDEHYLLYNDETTSIYQRNNILKLHSLIFNQFQHDAFKPTFLYGWRKANFYQVPKVPFKSLRELLFDLRDDPCLTCTRHPLIRCIHCNNVYCFFCFFVDYHFCNQL